MNELRGPWRRYRMLDGFYGLGIHRSPGGHWTVEFGPWVVTNEPGFNDFD